MNQATVAAALAAMLLTGGAADAASRKRAAGPEAMPRSWPHAVSQPRANPNAVYDYDGTILGVDPDPFIRLMLRREGNPRDQSGR